MPTFYSPRKLYFPYTNADVYWRLMVLNLFIDSIIAVVVLYKR